jgi:hypothetical protein
MKGEDEMPTVPKSPPPPPTFSKLDLVMANLDQGRDALSETGFKQIGDDRYIPAPKRYEFGWTPERAG